ncbi:SH3 domain-containing protein [Qipengyuania atrilutea]|uniref:SH3b domain-containing protein n=1 Tax=Qipengyuania atrilutea TaxID=2744473 RepID=A0A850GWI8_9SPHN|nr:SH3 domain-containing protein [Actirhodobacter atriluteus]NVD43901.1 hypothetical protein [Actirhodobacter atriluteus]
MKRHRILQKLLPIKPLVPLAAALAFVFGAPASAQEKEAPYWASIRESATEMNLRVGPSPEYKIAWVYRRPGLPVKVLRLKDGWRLIEDPDGAQGWVVARLLSPDRSAYVVGDGLAEMRSEPSRDAELKWRVEPGVSGKLGSCDEGWCRFEAQGNRGYIEADRLWGTGEP